MFFFFYLLLCVAATITLGEKINLTDPNAFVYGGMIAFPIVILATTFSSLLFFPVVWLIEWFLKDTPEVSSDNIDINNKETGAALALIIDCIEEAQKEIDELKEALNNENYLISTPKDIVLKDLSELAELEAKLAELEASKVKLEHL